MVEKFNVALFGLIALLAVGVAQAEEQQVPSTQKIIDTLKPTPPSTTRSLGTLRGVSMEVPTKPPSLDMYISFNFGSAELTDAAKAELVKLGKALLSDELMGFSFELAGHTDAVGSDEANMVLSIKRAQAVKQHLVQVFGIAGKRMVAKGYGESQLAVPSDPENGNNRRVQIINVGAK